MALHGFLPWLILLISIADAGDIFHDWTVTLQPGPLSQQVITINGMFPGPLINASTNDIIHVNVYNNMDEPLLFTWNGIQQRLNSWQDGVSGTNCPIPPGQNWTYVFQLKDQIGSFFYFPSINFQKAGGGFGPIRINNRMVVTTPFPKPEAEFDLLIGDWYQRSYKEIRSILNNISVATNDLKPDTILMNGEVSSFLSQNYQYFNVTKGMTYRFRISNVGTTWSFNFRIQNHLLVLIETEGSYPNMITLDSLDVHVGQSYSVLVTVDQEEKDYYIVASPKMANATQLVNLTAVGVLHYGNSTVPACGPLPAGPDPFDLQFSLHQARSIKWNLTAGAARPNPQGTFNVHNVTLTQTFILHGSSAAINGTARYTVNNVSYVTPNTPLKMADYRANGSGVYQLDQFPTNYSLTQAVDGVFVASGIHKGWIEIVFKNDLQVIDSWHLDGFGFFVVGFGDGEWTPESRQSYNLWDPVVRSTTQVYPGGWTAVYAYLDNPGMWNLRSQRLKNWYLGEEFYVRVYDPDPNPLKEFRPPENLLFCGIFDPPVPEPAPSVAKPPATPAANPAPLSAPPSLPNATASQQIPW
ncbi:hypothetical protein SLEP1_g5488 [Rubroshorea leprosula]|uniref:Monocopper oxidase-like protein SKU5 n=2 Tax=Rubroshorea leprosula TaxID=152421 RepID=A0AAV5I2W6_9ROSI|nr:hypothetical protein SLEP1_g5488 [Rubroshorea leprosula]